MVIAYNPKDFDPKNIISNEEYWRLKRKEICETSYELENFINDVGNGLEFDFTKAFITLAREIQKLKEEK